jgi:Helix-turn-helix of DDE superfamily endonuclease
MQNYNDLKLNEAQFLSVVGVKLQQFNILVQFFEPCWEAYISVYTTSGDYRRTVKKQRKDDVFPDIETMLIFILSYMKNNPLQQAHAASFNMNQPQANQWIHLLKKILNTTLEKANCIPCRTVDALNKLLVEGQDVLIDGTERPILRPSDPDVQKEFYSGKKKPHD